MNAAQCYQAGQLYEAIASATSAVKSAPQDAAARGLFCELLCFAGELERADKQLDALAQLDPQLAVGVALWRQLIRAEQARRQFYSEGRLPEYLDRPSPELECRLKATVFLRDGQAGEAARLLDQAESQRARVRGACDGHDFDDLRDLDDLTASFFETLTSTGKYYWIPIERVERLELHPCHRPLDLLWRRANMTVRGGPDGEVFLPTIYAQSEKAGDEQALLGRTTRWQGGDGNPVRGIGQRTLLVGDQDRPILEIGCLEFSET